MAVLENKCKLCDEKFTDGDSADGWPEFHKMVFHPEVAEAERLEAERKAKKAERKVKQRKVIIAVQSMKTTYIPNVKNRYVEPDLFKRVEPDLKLIKKKQEEETSG